MTLIKEIKLRLIHVDQNEIYTWGSVCLALSGLQKLLSISQTLPAKQLRFHLGLTQKTESMQIQPCEGFYWLVASERSQDEPCISTCLCDVAT